MLKKKKKCLIVKGIRIRGLVLLVGRLRQRELSPVASRGEAFHSSKSEGSQGYNECWTCLRVLRAVYVNIYTRVI